MLTAPERVEVIREYARRANRRPFDLRIPTFIETGSGDGSTTAALIEEFDRLFTIELNHGFYLHCVKRFLREPKVTPLWGDSEEVLKEVLWALDEPAVFWLDAHYDKSGGVQGRQETPIEIELAEIFKYPHRHVILIDDARLFGPDPAYPTLDQVARSFRYSQIPWVMTVQDDIIRIVPEELA